MRGSLHHVLLVLQTWTCLTQASLLDDLNQVVTSILGKKTEVTPGARNPVCAAINAALPGVVSYPDSTSYASSLKDYYSQQNSALHPGCFVRPRNTQDVSKCVKILSRAYQSDSSNQFAIKSGGHTSWPGAANIANGVTLDLSSLNATTLSNDHKTAQIQPGATWGDVYSSLEANGLAVSGGRVAQVGVGGLSLGGGISFFSPKTGFVCDNIVAYEIVLANSSVVCATQQQNHDLWLALKGGSNNFGIVTRFTISTFPQGKLWGGQTIYTADTVPRQLQALGTFAGLGNPYDEFASLIQTHTFTNPLGIPVSVVVNNMEYTIPTPNPPSLQPFTNIPHLTSTNRIDSLHNLAVELGSSTPDGMRQFEMSMTYETDAALLDKTYALFDATKATVANVSGLTWLLIFEPLPTNITSKSAAKGGNVLGLEANTRPLMIVLLQAIWSNAADDALVVPTMKGLYADIRGAAQAAGKSVPYEYLNYADYPSQDPLASYGAGNKAFLQRVSEAYDPRGVFQKAAPGGFKLFT